MHSCKSASTCLLRVVAALCMLATAVPANAELLAFSTPARALRCSLAQASCCSPGEEAASSLRLFKKPFYPPLERFAQRRQLLVKSVPCMDTSSSEAAPPPVCPECSCDDIAARLLVLEREQRLLVQSVARLERVMRELLHELEASDDIALLERLACNSMVYNIELTSKRDLRLLRSALLKIISKFV